MPLNFVSQVYTVNGYRSLDWPVRVIVPTLAIGESLPGRKEARNKQASPASPIACATGPALDPTLCPLKSVPGFTVSLRKPPAPRQMSGPTQFL